MRCLGVLTLFTITILFGVFSCISEYEVPGQGQDLL